MSKKKEQVEQTEAVPEIAEDMLPEQEPVNEKGNLPAIFKEPEEKQEEKAENKEKPVFCDAEFFYKNVFKPVFQLSSIYSGYKSLEIVETEEVAARATSDELFRIIDTTPSLAFLKKFEWIEKYSLIAVFVLMKGKAVYSEYREKHPKNTIDLKEGKDYEVKPEPEKNNNSILG